MRVTTLVENDGPQNRSDLNAEFGLSLHVELPSARILFDMGPSAVFADNAVALGIDLSAVDAAVVSHQHFDHGGGLARFFEINHGATVFLRDSPFVDRWFKALGVVKRPIGLDFEVLERHRDRIELVAARREIAPGCFVVTEIGSAHRQPRGNRHLYARSGGAMTRDPFDHELLMVAIEDDGMAVFTGCSHSGVLNMVEAAASAFPDMPIKAVFGGFHLIGLPFYNSMAAGQSEVRSLGSAMLDRVSGTTYSGHCTGDKGFGVLKGVMGDALARITTGSTIDV